MPFAIQYSQDSGSTFQQFGITTEDITFSGAVCNVFNCIKDSHDNVYVLAIKEAIPVFAQGIIKISKNGDKTKTTLTGGTFFGSTNYVQLKINRSESRIYFIFNRNGEDRGLHYIDIASIVNNASVVVSDYIIEANSFLLNARFCFFRNLYTWTTRSEANYDNSINLYDQESKIKITSAEFTSLASLACDLDVDNNFYVVSGDNKIYKFIFDGISTMTKLTLATGTELQYTKQMIMDKWGDLIIITNNGTASTLLKYSTAGVQIGTAIDLDGARYNLNTDKDGNYYYSNALGTWKVPKNTAQGQAIAPLNQHVKIRDNGMTTFGNNISGYNPTVFS